MPILKDYQTIVAHTSRDRVYHQVLITYITKEEEDKIDNGETIVLQRGNQTFSVSTKNIYCYGEIDFKNGSDDLNLIDDFNWLEHLGLHGIDIPSDYDYNEHACYSPNPSYRTYDTTVPSKVVKWKHGLLGKPKRVVIFKRIIDAKQHSKPILG